MAQRVITVNIGQEMTFAAETEYKAAKPKVFKSFSMPTPEGFLTDGVVTSDEEQLSKFVRGFKAHMLECRMNNKKVIFVADSKRIAGREESLPKLSEQKLRAMVQTNAAEYFPVAMDAYQVTLKIIEEPKKEDKSVKVQLYAIPSDIVGSYERLSELLELSLLTIDCRTNAITQMTKSMAAGGNLATLYMSNDEVIFTVAAGGIMQMQRSIAYGVGELYDMVSADRQKAIQKLHDESIFENEEARQEIDDSLMMMTGSLKRMLEFYKSKFFETELEGIYVVGLGDGIKGMAAYLTEKLDVEIRHSMALTGGKDVDTTELARAIAVCGAIAPLEIDIGGKQASKTGISSLLAEDDNYRPTLVLFGLLVVAAVALTVWPYLQYKSAVREGLSLDNTIATLQPAKEVYKSYIKTCIEFEDLQELEKLTNTLGNRTAQFLQELEAKMPRNATVSAISAGSESISIDFIAPSKAVASQVLIQLRGFDSVLDAETTSLDETTSEEGVTEVRFTVNCVYRPQDEEV